MRFCPHFVFTPFCVCICCLHRNDAADFGGEKKSFFFFCPLFFAEGNRTKLSFISNCPGAGVDCGSFFFLSEHKLIFLFLFLLFGFLKIYFERKRGRGSCKINRDIAADFNLVLQGMMGICGCLLRHPSKPSAPPSG